MEETGKKCCSGSPHELQFGFDQPTRPARKDGWENFRRDSDGWKVRWRPVTATELAGGDRNFRLTRNLDRKIPTPSTDAQICRKPNGDPSNPKTTTGEGAAGGSWRPKVHRTSGNPPMTTPGTLNFTGHLLMSLFSSSCSRRRGEGERRLGLGRV
ncbi:hypothetical protein Cgig2_033809 [Carnegiea gigantea]|uniref:Uncharacterized protein n=1 Tax=Carnegiea gigantea TaxID=171969 RepID=A0A9Q1K923_9CARY|nr:hypothetical protein Cgig2_033809 [Carnegiea gigantea]